MYAGEGPPSTTRAANTLAPSGTTTPSAASVVRSMTRADALLHAAGSHGPCAGRPRATVGPSEAVAADTGSVRGTPGGAGVSSPAGRGPAPMTASVRRTTNATTSAAARRGFGPRVARQARLAIRGVFHAAPRCGRRPHRWTRGGGAPTWASYR